MACFRDELPRLFPADERARKLADNSFLLSEFLERENWQPPPLPRRLMVQTHCHHHASLDVDAEKKQLQRLNATVDWLDAGRSEEHTSELQSLMRISYAVFCLKNKKNKNNRNRREPTKHDNTQITYRTMRNNNK